MKKKQQKKQRPLTVDWDFIDRMEKELRITFRKYLYDPIMKILEDTDVLENADTKLLQDALKSGRIKYWDNKFTGRFSAEITRELKALGAVWHPKTASFHIPLSKLPTEMQNFLFLLNRKLISRLIKAEGLLKKINPDVIAKAFLAKNLVKTAVRKSEKKVEEAAKDISFKPDKATMEAVAKDWDYKIGADISNWGQEVVTKFRKELSALIYQGKRFGTATRPGELEQEILDLYGMKIKATIAPGVQVKNLTDKQKESILKKANFIARNETRLLMTSYTYTRMQNSGSTFFRWLTVVGSAAHPVRPSHKILNRKIFRWDTPPIDEQTGKQVLPGQAYNCRCTAVPLWDEDIAKDKDGNFKQNPDGSYIYK